MSTAPTILGQAEWLQGRCCRDGSEFLVRVAKSLTLEAFCGCLRKMKSNFLWFFLFLVIIKHRRRVEASEQTLIWRAAGSLPQWLTARPCHAAHFMVTLPCHRRNVHPYEMVRRKAPQVCTSWLRGNVMFSSPGSTWGSPPLVWIFSLQEPSVAFIVHLYSDRKRQKRLQLRGSVLHTQKDLLLSTSCQALAVSEVLSEWITGDTQCDVCALHCTASLLDLAKLRVLHWENRRSCWLPPFCGNNLYARKEKPWDFTKFCLPIGSAVFHCFRSPKGRINCIEIPLSHF